MNPALTSRAGGALAAALITPLAVLLGYALLSLPPNADGLAAAVESELPRSGVSNPVTAVLLNFRGYDTMLEIAVLLMAILGARALTQTPESTAPAPYAGENTVLMGFIRLVSPILVLVAGYMLWVGGHAPGGAFQAGAVFASLGVIWSLCGMRFPVWYKRGAENLVVTAGLSSFIAVGIAAVAVGGNFLEYRERDAKWLILAIETACTLSIGATLAALFAVGHGRGASSAPNDDRHSIHE